MKRDSEEREVIRRGKKREEGREGEEEEPHSLFSRRHVTQIYRRKLNSLCFELFIKLYHRIQLRLVFKYISPVLYQVGGLF